ILLGVDDDPWSPPSESELKILRARRERQDRISRLMGDYLLKGYKMLGESCDTCGTILLQDRQKKFLCVSCQELDSDTEKDNPVLNPQAALSQVREHQLCHQARDQPRQDNIPPPHPQAALSERPSLNHFAETALLEKMKWASMQLQEAASVEYSTQLCALIGSCAQSLQSLRDLHH
uniref:Zinc ribbon domain containing 2 n=1 Tax=Leptobrachium leishanense TaxID=445787 RepID=A0A8C5Q7N8_9ANUR